MYILGLSCFYHESAASLIFDGKPIAASAEERFSRIKHDNSFPSKSIEFCLNQANITPRDLSYVVFYEKPFWKFQRVLMSSLGTYPSSFRLFSKGMMNLLTEKLWVRSIISEKLKIDASKILFVPHHISHAASAYYCSGFDTSAILTVDGVGEWTTTALGLGIDNKIKMSKEIRFPHSLGLLYSVFTAYLGFEVNDGEYKVMGMAPYGKPKYLNKVRKLVRTYKDGSYSLNMEYFSFHKSLSSAYNRKFIDLFGAPRSQHLSFFTKNSGYPTYFGNKPNNYDELCRVNQRYADIAASIQEFTEDRLLALALQLSHKYKTENLCIAGGVGLNSVANTILLNKSKFKRIFVQPAAGDDGGSLGCALYAHHAILNNKKRFILNDCYLGPSFSNSDIEKLLKRNKFKYKKINDEEILVEYVASALSQDLVVGFFHGRSEWGPRALGARSILASPLKDEMKEIVNTKIKFREPYRPFAPVVLEEKVKDYFEVDGIEHERLTRFMLGVFPVKSDMRKKIPAVTHIDGSARLQIIKRKQNPRYYDIVKKFGEKTGVFVLMNTSFNLKGEPIVTSPEDALSTFRRSGLDILVLENFIIGKSDLM